MDCSMSLSGLSVASMKTLPDNAESYTIDGRLQALQHNTCRSARYNLMTNFNFKWSRRCPSQLYTLSALQQVVQ